MGGSGGGIGIVMGGSGGGIGMVIIGGREDLFGAVARGDRTPEKKVRSSWR